MASIPLPSYLAKVDIQALMEACIRFYAVELLGEGYQGYFVTSWQISRLGFKWKSSLGFFKDISQITGQNNIKKAYSVLAGWEKEAPDELSSPSETQEVSETVPQNLNELVEALEKAKSQEEKSALIRSYQAFKATAPAAQVAPITETMATEGVGIKITPEALKFLEQSLSKTTEAPFKLVTFFSSPKFLSETPQAKRALVSSVSLPKITKRAEGLPESERRRLLELVENLRQAEFSFFAQTKLSRRIFSVREITILMGPEIGLGQGEVVSLIQGGAPPGKRPSLLGRLFGGIARRAITKAATKAVTSALTKAGISITTKTVTAGIGTAIGGPIGTALGLAVGWVIDKILGPLINKITDFISQNKWVLAIPFVAAGLILGLPLLTVGGLAMGGLLLAGGVGPALSGVAAGVFGVLTSVLSLVIASIAMPLIVALISVPLIVALILFIINSGAYIVPPKPVSDFPFIGFPVECTTEKLPISFPNTTSSPIAGRAWEIVSDLYQGFWCSWNRSPGDFPDDITLYPPSYPELFNEDWFARDPYASRSELSRLWNSLFWCTHLVQKAYRETGNTGFTVSLNSQNIQDDFTRRSKFIPSSEATPQNVVSGSIVFFHVFSGPSRTNHAGIVYSITQDDIIFIQANTPTKEGFITFNSVGKGLQDLPGIEVVGIGLP